MMKARAKRAKSKAKPRGKPARPAPRRRASDDILAIAKKLNAAIRAGGAATMDKLLTRNFSFIDSAGRVVYLGTFSKTVFPSLRTGYLVVPAPLVDAFTSVIRQTGHTVPAAVQAALADFLSEGHFAAHIRRTRALYAARQERLITMLTRHLGGAPATRPELAARASPLHGVRPGAPPFFLAHGTNDTMVDCDHTRRLAARLTEAGVPVETRIVPGADHVWVGLPDDELESVFSASLEWALRRVE